MFSAHSDSHTVPWRVTKTRRRFLDDRAARGDGSGRVHVTERDRELLAFAAAHRFVHAEHVHRLVGADRSITYRLLSRLTDAGLLRYERIFHAKPGVFMVTNGGLAIIESSLPKPAIDLRLYRHEQFVPNVWLAAREGAFGPFEALHTERELRHRDRVSESAQIPLGVRLGGFDRAGRPRVHHPDVLVAHAGGGFTAVELELSLKGRRRLEEILMAYRLDDHYRRVVYLVDQRAVRDKVSACAQQLCVEDDIDIRCLMSFDLDEIHAVMGGAS